MKPEDQKALLSAWAKTNHHNGDHDWVTYMLGWQAALAHRDAQPAVAVNEILPSLPEPALQGNTGVCCGNPTTGGEYMGQSESICCGQFEEYVPDYYTAEQMQAYARTAVRAAEAAKGGV
jgi:hypothetical protein